MDLKGRKVLIVGMARSGISCAKLLKHAGAFVIANDMRSIDEFDGKLVEVKDCVDEWRLGMDTMEAMQDCDMLVLSPSAPLSSDWAQKALRVGKEVIGEIELAYRFCKGKIIGITGTNGKTTTTALTGQIFKDAGYNTFVLGNIGLPFAEEVLKIKEDDIVVAEVAGFQLESTVEFHPCAAAMLNITPDHLDRFGDMDTYTQSKAEVFKNMSQGDYLILNAEDKRVAALATKAKCGILYFDAGKEVQNGAHCVDGKLYYTQDGEVQFICEAKDVRIPGRHNLENALAASALAACMGVNPGSIAKTLKSFVGVEHRIEYVCEKHGVIYINDSKGTNPDAAIKAVQAMDRHVVLIAGGFDKHAEFDTFIQSFGDTVQELVLFGETAVKIEKAARAEGFTNIHLVKDLRQAVLAASSLAKPGWAVLLSPACASWDMFEDFEQRGRHFKQFVNEL